VTVGLSHFLERHVCENHGENYDSAADIKHDRTLLFSFQPSQQHHSVAARVLEAEIDWLAFEVDYCSADRFGQQYKSRDVNY